jgi:hypothetical protein
MLHELRPAGDRHRGHGQIAQPVRRRRQIEFRGAHCPIPLQSPACICAHPTHNRGQSTFSDPPALIQSLIPTDRLYLINVLFKARIIQSSINNHPSSITQAASCREWQPARPAGRSSRISAASGPASTRSSPSPTSRPGRCTHSCGPSPRSSCSRRRFWLQ